MPPPAVTIRPFEPAQAVALWAVFHSSVHGLTTAQYDARQRAAWAPPVCDAPAWAARMAALQPFVAWRDGVIAGYADLQPSGYIDHFYVAAEHAGHGVGRRLMTHLLQVADARGLPELHADVSLTAQPLFRAFGFVKQADGGPHRAGVHLPNARMVLRLGSARPAP